MTVQTTKFSDFASENLNTSTNKVVGVGGGANFQGSAVITWTTSTRPSAPYNGLIGLNTDLEQYEFYNSNTHAWVQLSSSNINLTWNNVTGISASMQQNNGYVTNNAGQVQLTMPATSSFGEVVSVCGYGSGGWKVLLNPLQNIVFGSVVSTTGTGYLASTNQFDQIELLCVVANTTWVSRNSLGNITIV